MKGAIDVCRLPDYWHHCKIDSNEICSGAVATLVVLGDIDRVARPIHDSPDSGIKDVKSGVIHIT